MKTLVRFALVLALTLGIAAEALACVLNGRDYPPGTVFGDRVCGADGRWQPR
jgi:hypothetical protein